MKVIMSFVSQASIWRPWNIELNSLRVFRERFNYGSLTFVIFTLYQTIKKVVLIGNRVYNLFVGVYNYVVVYTEWYRDILLLKFIV